MHSALLIIPSTAGSKKLSSLSSLASLHWHEWWRRLHPNLPQYPQLTEEAPIQIVPQLAAIRVLTLGFMGRLFRIPRNIFH